MTGDQRRKKNFKILEGVPVEILLLHTKDASQEHSVVARKT